MVSGRYASRGGEAGGLEGGLVSADRGCEPSCRQVGPAARGEALPYKAMWAARRRGRRRWEEGSWGAEGGDGEPSWIMVAPRFGGRYGGRGAVLGARPALLGRWGGGASPGRRGEPTRDFP